MTTLRITQCRSCDAPIMWVLTSKGKKMPLDAEPSADGNVELLYDSTVIVHGQSSFDAGPRYKSHFATCPNAEQWKQ